MRMNNPNSLDVFDVLIVIFVTLKVIGVQPVAGWPWWAVLMPFWFVLAIIAAAGIYAWFIKKDKKEKGK